MYSVAFGVCTVYNFYTATLAGGYVFDALPVWIQFTYYRQDYTDLIYFICRWLDPC